MPYFDSFDPSKTPIEKLQHLLLPKAESYSDSSDDNSTSFNKAVKKLTTIYGQRFNSRFAAILQKRTFKFEDIPLVADICKIRPSEVVGQMFNEKNYDTVSTSDQSILNFHNDISSYDRRKLRKIVYDDISNKEQNLKWFAVLPVIVSMPKEKQDLILNLIKYLS